MKLTYSLTVLDNDGNMVVDHELTADEAMLILAPHIGKPAPADAVEETAPTLEKRAYKKGTPKAPAPSKAPLKVKGQKVCKNCGVPGHIAKTCKSPAATSSDPLRRMAGPAASDETPDLAKFPVSTPPVSEDDFIEAKRLRDGWGDTSQSIAKSIGIDEKQVKRIIRCDSYAQYLGK